MTLREWLQQAPYALTMTSGFFGFFAHCGVLSVLEQEDLLPVRVSGSSAGALVTGCWAAGLSTERLQDTLLHLRRSDFWDVGIGLGLLKGEKFRQLLRDVLPVQRLENCAIPAAFSAWELRSRQTRVLKQGPMAESIQASCAFPFLFHPVRVGERLYLDGGIADRPGLLGMPEGERVLLHHLASRSPWRRKNSPALKTPSRPNMTALVIQELPRVGPFRLEEGIRAMEHAMRRTERALEQEIVESNVIV